MSVGALSYSRPRSATTSWASKACPQAREEIAVYEAFRRGDLAQCCRLRRARDSLTQLSPVKNDA